MNEIEIKEINQFLMYLQKEFFRKLELRDIEQDSSFFEIGELIEITCVVYKDIISAENLLFLKRLIVTSSYKDKDDYIVDYRCPLIPIRCALHVLTLEMAYLLEPIDMLTHGTSRWRRWIQFVLAHIIDYVDNGLLMKGLNLNIKHDVGHTDNHTLLFYFSKGDYWEKVHYIRHLFCKYKDSTIFQGFLEDIKNGPSNCIKSIYNSSIEHIFKELTHFLNEYPSINSFSNKSTFFQEIMNYLIKRPINQDILQLSDFVKLD